MVLGRTILLLAALLAPLPVLAAVPDIVVKGAVPKPVSFTWTALHNFPAIRVSVTQASSSGPLALDCSGAALSAVLDAARPVYGEAKDARLAHGLVIRSGDGHAVLLAVAETDAGPNRPAPILATACNGRDLSAPRLVVPGDAGAGRAVNGVVSIEVVKW